MSTSEIIIRPIQASDNAALANIIRRTLEEFGANHPGTVYYDESTDRLSEIFEANGSCYFVAEKEDVLLGGAGIYPTEALPNGVCELVKMYLLPIGRGTGLGKKLMEKCLNKARELGYQKVYLETMPELTSAIPMYEKFGFRYLDAPLGNSGHFGCAIQMLKLLDA
jgi:putative acetyltransferase